MTCHKIIGAISVSVLPGAALRQRCVLNDCRFILNYIILDISKAAILSTVKAIFVMAITLTTQLDQKCNII